MFDRVDEYRDVLVNALNRLDIEVRALGTSLKYKSPYAEEFDIFDWPRPRFVTICDGITWPWYEGVVIVFSDFVAFMLDEKTYLAFDEPYKRKHVADTIIARCRLRPRKVLRALRRIEVAADWCVARQKGVIKAIAELHRQQAPWDKELLREHHLLKLGGNVTPPDPIS